MKYTVRNLELYQDIICGVREDNGNGILSVCTSSVTRSNLNPQKDECLSYRQECTDRSTLSIPGGNYLFVQGYLNPQTPVFAADGRPADELYDAALQLWLEFIWQEKKCADESVFVRTLIPDEKENATEKEKRDAGTIFQLFRREENS